MIFKKGIEAGGLLRLNLRGREMTSAMGNQGIRGIWLLGQTTTYQEFNALFRAESLEEAYEHTAPSALYRLVLENVVYSS